MLRHPGYERADLVAILNVDTLHPCVFGRRWQALMTGALYILDRNNRSGARGTVNSGQGEGL